MQTANFYSVKKILIVVFYFLLLPVFAFPPKANLDTTSFQKNPFLEYISANFIGLDSSLSYLQVYDPAIQRNYYGLGFPGSASRSLIYLGQKKIQVNPIFNSFSSYLFSTNFQTDFDLKKPLTLVQYVIFPSLKTEQYLDLFHSRNISKNFNVGFKIRKVKSNGYYLNQGSNITNVLAFSDFHSVNNRYRNYFNIVYNGLVSIENGGVVNDSVEFSSKSINLKSLPVNLNDAKNRVTLFGGSIFQSYNFGKTSQITVDSLTTKSVFVPSSRISVSLDYSKHATTYLDGNPLSGYYFNVNQDSIDTFDKLSYSKYTSEFSYTTLEVKRSGIKRLVLSTVGIANEQSILERRDFVKTFTNSSTFVNFRSLADSPNRFNLRGSYFFDGYNKDNFESEVLLGRRFLDSSNVSFTTDLIFEYQQTNPDYVYQNYFSNHFIWKNSFDKLSSSSLNFWFKSKGLFNLNIKYESLTGYIYLDSASKPSQLTSKLNYFSGKFCKLFQVGSFYLNANVVYQKVIDGKDVLSFPEWYTRNSMYWAGSVFKKALDLQIGFDVLFTSKYFGLAYQPGLNSFYFQNKKQVGGYPSVDFFVNFKIRQARLFLKVDHLNYGWSGGKSEFVPNYLLPGRTFRFGITWLFLN